MYPIHTKAHKRTTNGLYVTCHQINTTPALDDPTAAPTAAPADTSALSHVLTVSNSPYSLRNHNFPTSSISNPKTLKKKTKRKITMKLLSTIPLYPTLFPLFPQRLLIDILDRQSPTTHIHWEIATFMPPPSPQNKIKFTIDDKVTFHHPPAPDAFSATRVS